MDSNSTKSALDARLAEVVRGKHHQRCENVENDTCGHECFMVCLGHKILATTPGASEVDRHVADFIAAAFNQQQLAAIIAEGHYVHE